MIGVLSAPPLILNTPLGFTQAVHLPAPTYDLTGSLHHSLMALLTAPILLRRFSNYQLAQRHGNRLGR